MQADTIKLLFTYVIATIVITGGGLMLYATRLDPVDSNSSNLALLIAGFIGAAITFVFGQESATRASRAAQSQSTSTALATTAALTQGAAAAGSVPPIYEGDPATDPTPPPDPAAEPA